MKQVLITGASGFLGHWLIDALKSDQPNLEIVSLSRKPKKQAGVDRAIQADLSRWDAGLSEADIANLQSEKFDLFIHLAGLYDLRVSSEDGYLHNVFGTHSALHLAELFKIPTFAHISTVAVTMGRGRVVNHRMADASIRRPEFHERPSDAHDNRPIAPDQEVRGPFPDHYATSKSEAEKLVRNWSGEFPKRKLILRPGILVGDSKEGKILRVDGPYQAIDAFRRLRKVLEIWQGRMPRSLRSPLPLPGHPDRRIPLVPVDLAARVISKITLSFSQSEELTKSYYVAPSNGPTAGELYSSALKHLGLNCDVHITSGIPDSIVKPVAEWVARLPREELEYVINLPDLDLSSSDAIVRELLGNDFYPPFSQLENTLWRGFDGYAQNR